MTKIPAFTLLALALTACASEPPPPPVAPLPLPASPPAAPSFDPRAQVFADVEVPPTFADVDRKKKVLAAAAEVDALFEDARKSHGFPSVSYGIVVDGELVHARSFGTVDLDAKRAPTADTMYRIGSISKSFTALAVLSLRDEGKMPLDEPLARWIPEAAKLVYPSRDAPLLTIRHLLVHRSGLPRMGTINITTQTPPEEAAVARSLAGLALDSAPGSAFQYSNLGFGLLGIAAGRAAGKPYRAVMQERLFGPLGMTSTTFDTPRDPARRARGYSRRGGKLKPAAPWALGALEGAGGIWSSVRDLAKYVSFQLDAYPPRDADDNASVRRSSRREAHGNAIAQGLFVKRRDAKRGESEVAGWASAYAYGWSVVETCEVKKMVSHNGSVDGFGSALGFLPDLGIGIVALANEGGAALDAPMENGLALLKQRADLKPRVKEPKVPARLAKALDALLDVYATWDEAKYKAMLSPKRPPIAPAAERDELAGYRAFHGACQPGKVLSSDGRMHANFELQCEKGHLQMAIALDDEDGKISGFNGTSTGVPAEPEVAKVAAQLTGLVKRWDAATAKAALSYPSQRTPADDEKFFAGVRAAHGACTVGKPLRFELRSRSFALTCDRGGDLQLRMNVDQARPHALKGFTITNLGGSTCPRKS